MKLTAENYYDLKQEYMSYSQYMQFRQCEAQALADIEGRWRRPETTALLQGSYIDAHVEGRLDGFIAEHPEMISSRGPTKGELKAEYRQLNNIITRMERDKFFLSFLEGDKQTILTGEIAGVLFKGKLDIVTSGRIVDFKCVKDFQSIYDTRRAERVNFIEYWGWTYQAAIYTELARQSGLGEPQYYIAAVTKETEPDLAVIHIPKDILALRLQEIEYLAPTYQAIKLGIAEPYRCERCDYCKSTKELKEVIELEELDYD